jgi:Flp pilus assembly protein CpaB
VRRGFRTSRLYLVVGLAFAGAAVVLLRPAVSGGVGADSAGPTVGVVIAAQPIERGQAVAPDDLSVVPWPRALAPPGSFRRTTQPAGRIALTALAPGEAVTETRLARVRAGPVASLVPQGLRALAVPSSLPAGSVVAGDHVDVLATYPGDFPRTEMVAGGVEVLLVLGPGGTGASTADVGLDAAAATIGGGATTLVLLVPEAEQGRLASARSLANLEVTIAPTDET